MGWEVVTIGDRRYRAQQKSHKDEFAHALKQQQEYPTLIMKVGERTYWMFQDKFYWEDENLTDSQVYALIVTRQQRRARQIETAEQIVAIGSEPRSTQRTTPEGPSALFLSFMRRFAPGTPSRTHVNKIYDVRGEITHGERLLHLDRSLPSVPLDQISAKDREIGDNASVLCRGALINWLWSHDPETTDPLLTKGLPSTKPARPGTKSGVIVSIPPN